MSEPRFSLDVVIPTYNRSARLRLTLQSLLDARLPEGLAVTVFAVDNNSRDDTAAAIASYRAAFGGRFEGGLRYVHETRPGRSSALNAGLAQGSAEFVGMIDDDERVDAGWFEEIVAALGDGSLDFITGPCAPEWGAEPPAWLPMRPSSVIGWVDCGPRVRTFGVDFDGVLMGGNAVVRRRLLEQVGGYDPSLGRTSDGRLMSLEDEDMQRRLMAAGGRGQYRPGLVIHHYIPPNRMTREYHRRWFFWLGASRGVAARKGSREAVPHLFATPRYHFGVLARNAAWFLPGLAGVGPLAEGVARFDARMHVVGLLGYWYGLKMLRPAGAKSGGGPAARSPRAATG